MFKGNGTYKNSEAYTKTAEKAQTLSQGYEPSANSFAQSADEIIPNSNSQSQAPQKSLLEQARENTERLRAAQEAEQIAQKEAELARLKEMQAKNAEILAQKEAAAGQAINEVQNLQIGTPIKAQKISDTKIIINDNTPPFKAEFIIAKKDDIKPNFERTGTQGRSERQDKVIESIQSDFKPHLIFEQMGGFEGLPIILKDGQVIAGNHRAQAIKGLTGEQLARYKQAAKEKFGIDLKDDEVIVRLVKDGDEKELINLAFMSNVGRESNIGEKALANLAKYESNMQNLPSHINADSVFELESQVAKALDTQGNGLNVFDTNLALLSKIAKNSSNTDILESLNTLKSLSQDEKEKVLRMFVSNAGEFLNIAKDTQLKSLNLNDYLADALIVAAKNVDEKTRKANFQSLFNDIQTMLASAKEMLKIDPFLFENFKSKALGYALARFARLENPAGKLFDFLKASKADLENLYTGGLFDTNKAISDIDIYDFLKHAINSGDDLMDNGVNLKHAITSKLDDLRKVENALIDSGEIQFAKSKAKPQGREAKETNINSLFADDELQMQATKPTKELNLSDEKDFNELGEFFKLNLKDKEFNEIYDKAAATAQRLGVKVRFDESAGRSHFVLNDNTITIAAGNKELFQAQDLLHELIHATTRKALKDFNENPTKAAQSYTKRQIEAINEINSLYLKSKGIAKRQGKDAYALQNVDEFVAELSSSEFRAFLKAQDIFERFIKALIRFFTGDSERLAKNVNSYKALKESYYKILDDYEPPLAPQKIADEKALKSVDELNLSENLGKTEQDYTNAYFQKLKKENPNLSDEQLLDKLRFDKEVIKGSIEWLKSNTKIFYGVLGYSKTDAELENFFRGGTKTLAHRRKMIENYYNITPLKEFGTNYAEFYRDSKNAVRKLFFEAKVAEQSGEKFNGQVAGAFYRQDLGDIDLVWGNDEIGLKKIIDKHLSDFADFKGDTAQDKLANALGEIVKDGKLINDKGVNTLYFSQGEKVYLVGLSEGFNGVGNNKWIITSYKVENIKPHIKEQIGSANKTLSADESLKEPQAFGSTADTNEIIPQNELKSQVSNNDEPKYFMDFYYGARKKDFLQVNELMNDYLNAPDTATAAQVAEKLKQKQSELLNDAEKIKKEYFTKAHATNDEAPTHFKAEFLSKNKRKKLEGQWAWNEYASNKIDEFLAKNADESQVLSAYDRNILENAPKETIEAHLKSIEKDIDYLEKGIDFYKKNPEQDYNGEMIKFNEKLLTPKLQMQKAYKQRLDELNLSENLGKSQGTAEIQKRSVQDYVNEFEQTFSSKIDEMNSHSFYNGGSNVVKRFKENVETIKELNLPPLAEQTAINKLLKLYTKQMNSWYPSMMSVGGANYNVKKGEKSFEIWGKTNSEISELMENLKDTSKKIVQNESDIYSDEFVKIAPFALATGAQRIGISFNTKPSAKMIFALKKKGAIWNSLEKAWSFKPERFEQAKEWLENSFYELATGEKKILNLSKEIQEVKPKIESFKDEQKRLAKEYKEQQTAKKAEIADLKTQERIAKRKLADIKDSVKTTQEAIKRHESADSTSWMLPELKKQLELHKKDAQSAQQTLENIQQKIKELNSLDLSYAPKRSADEIQITLPKEKQTRFTMRQNAYKSLKEVEKTPLTNANDGRVAYLNKTGRQESLSDYAINESAKNGFDEAQHLATAQHLPELFENAKFKETTKDLKNNDNNVKIHRYTANFLLDNEPAQAQITLKETIAGQHSGNKIYTLKLESVSRLSPAEPQNPREALRTINDPKSSDFGEPSAKPSEIVSKIQEKFKFGEKKAKDLFEWHKDSSPLTKNDDGTPKVFYHGSPNEFEVFDIEKTRGELGHYFTDDKSYAEQYMRDNGKIYAVSLKSKNIISLFDPKAAQKYKKFIFGDDLPELEKILKEKYKSLKASEYDLDNYKSAFYDLMRERNDKNVLRVPSIIGERLKTAGVDGVVSYKGAIVVFDSNQIKSIDNAGSWTDSAGKITKEKPSDESARHSYFNAQSPNILHSNEIWGGGLAGGTLNGLETDENGNIIGFDPAKFVAGFIAGAAGTKAVKLMLNSKAGQNHALKVATNISDDFKALRENNLPLFAKIMQKIEPQTLLKSSKEAKNLSNEIFNKELQNAIKTAIDKGGIENLSELKKQVHFSKVSEFKAYFDEVKGNQGVIKTPYKDIKVNVFYAFNHFTDNTYKTNRDNIKSAFFSTFKKPLFVVEFTPQGKTKPSTYFYKPFYDENKKLLNLVGISIDEKGLLKFSTFYLDERGNRLKEFLKRTDLTIRYVEPSE